MADDYIKHLASDQAINDGDILPNTVAPIGEDSYGLEDNEDVQFHDRFGVTPLYTRYHDYAKPGEYLCDAGTGEPAIMREDGTVISVSETGRLNLHIESFSNALTYIGLSKACIYHTVNDDDCEVMCYEKGMSTLDDEPAGVSGVIPYEDYPNLLSTTAEFVPAEGSSVIDKIVMSLDMSIVAPTEGCTMLHLVEIDPIVQIEYTLGNGSVTQYVQKKASELRYSAINVQDNKFTLTGIKLPEVIDSEYTCFVHSILVGY